MCVEKNYCVCHLLKSAIKKDSKSHLRKKYFAAAQCHEIYDFLKSAYAIEMLYGISPDCDQIKEIRKILNILDTTFIAEADEAADPENEWNKQLTKQSAVQSKPADDYSRYKNVSTLFTKGKAPDVSLVQTECLDTLFNVFIDQNKSRCLNLVAEDYTAFKNALQTFHNGQDSRGVAVKEKLKSLVGKMEKLSSLNLCDRYPDFAKDVKKLAGQAPDAEEYSSHSCSIC